MLHLPLRQNCPRGQHFLPHFFLPPLHFFFFFFASAGVVQRTRAAMAAPESARAVVRRLAAELRMRVSESKRIPSIFQCLSTWRSSSGVLGGYSTSP